MISPREALEIVLHDVPLLDCEPVRLSDALDRVLAEDVRSDRDVPGFRNSAMDGYAVRAADTRGASASSPVTLRVLEMIPAGKAPAHEIRPGTASQIMTGAVVPDRADAVVKIEDTLRGAGDTVAVTCEASPGQNVRLPGEDVRRGEVALSGGRLLRPADIGVLASVGSAEVSVRRRPLAAVLTTGDELVDVADSLALGKVVDSNAYALAAAVREAGGVARVFGIVPDSPPALRAAFAEALEADVVLSTGGVSVGTFDLVRKTLADLGVKELFWKVAQKPGKPLAFGRRGATLVFGLPGNPVSSLVCFYVYVRPALRAMLGLPELHARTVHAVAGEDIKVAPGLTEFVRCTLPIEDGIRQARPAGSQSSGVLRSMALADGLLVSPPGKGLIPRGEAVRVMLLASRDQSEPPV